MGDVGAEPRRLLVRGDQRLNAPQESRPDTGHGDDVAVFRPSNSGWYVLGVGSLRYGTGGDVPVARDYDGDGAADVAVFRPSNGTWYLLV